MAAKKTKQQAPHLKEAAATQRMTKEELAKLLEKSAADSAEGKSADGDDDADDDDDDDDADDAADKK